MCTEMIYHDVLAITQVRWQHLESVILRKSLGMQDKQTGMRLCSCVVMCHVSCVLVPN